MRYTPVTSVTSVTTNGTALTAEDYSVTPFGLQRAPPREWSGAIEVEYVTGWSTGEEPEAIIEAMDAIERWLNTRPEAGITRETVDGVGTVVRSEAASGPPDIARLLLKRWTRS